MSVNLFFAALLLTSAGWAAPTKQPPRPQPNEDLNLIIRQLKNGMADLKHEMHNREAEMHLFENKMQAQEASYEHLRQQITEEIQSQRESTQATTINSEGKIETLNQSIEHLEEGLKALSNDIRQLKTQSNDSVVVLGQYRQKILEIEALINAQNQNLQNLELAFHSMLDAWQAKESAKDIALKTSESGKTYKVQSGDSLEKIARSQKVTVQALKEANQLTSDKIVVGKTLKIP